MRIYHQPSCLVFFFYHTCRPKSSFLPSYIIDVRELDEKLLNIVDMKFLHGYYEPTLLILYEPNQTWPGLVHHNSTCPLCSICLRSPPPETKVCGRVNMKKARNLTPLVGCFSDLFMTGNIVVCNSSL